ncbi:hypothetical protein MKO06_16935 [Gramella sp. GC03-9]|uniref:Uncharacterized protein n=1 Tax=Christiangramia oceanisediminis TaxID=2920386 RepID=A0A9X2L074_9FLAO|nr:hypothetical protein [Gramella oceanisediminis]MCP9201598.1 hypothetical protein [Gramella oceanisediminis]
MKRTILLLLFLLPSITISQISKGVWFWNSENGRNSLELRILKVDDKSVEGNYCSVFNNGEKIDCNSELENEVNFLLNKTSENTYQGTFTSHYSSANGLLKIIHIPLNKKMIFEIIEAPKGEYYLPEKAVLSQ